MLRRVPPLAPLFAAALLTLPAPSARGQGVRLGTDGQNDLRKEWTQNEAMAKDLIAGRSVADPKGEPKHEEALDAQAKWMTWRYFWLNESVKPKDVLRLYQEFDSDVFALKKGMPTTKEAARIYSDKIGKRGLEVIKHENSRLLAKVNVARVMARAAELGQPELADSFVAVLKVPELSEGARLYALRGLRELLAQEPPVLGAERLSGIVGVLTEAVERKAPFDPKVTPPEDVDGFRYVRREAVRALALVKDPSATGPGKPALTLLRVVAREGLSPEPRIDERIEAAIGLARMRPSSKDAKNYQPDYAVYQIARMLDDLAVAVNEDRQSIARAATREEQKVAGVPKRLPWLSYAVRLGDALRAMQAEVPNPYLAKLIPECLKLLGAVEGGSADVSAQSLLQFLERNPAPSDRLIKGVDSSTLKTSNGPPAK